ncbi:MAG TPA: secondary thiamine-phosphate synthase enzyme YjbQ [Dongiaceae bacterium]|nr:secondary thiamine-phosphate synthase enzyme YjbQ [Dongiaceae bacterium]
MAWFQHSILLQPRRRGFHLITDEILPQIHKDLRTLEIGLAHFFLQHTSASLTINENADPDVRVDMESHFNQQVPESAPYYRHTLEGPDDMPAHIKSSLLGCSLSVPIRSGVLALGTWQGIYLAEHRVQGGRRRLLVTLQGE